MHLCSVECGKLHMHSTITCTHRINACNIKLVLHIILYFFKEVNSAKKSIMRKRKGKHSLFELNWVKEQTSTHWWEACIVFVQHAEPTCQSCFCVSLETSTPGCTVWYASFWVQPCLSIGDIGYIFGNSIYISTGFHLTQFAKDTVKPPLFVSLPIIRMLIC